MSSARTTSALAAIAPVGGMSFVAAPTAAADQVWYQGIGRSAAADQCPTTSAEDAEAGWTEWLPSWEMWPNDGQGGDVCNRSITWLHESRVDAGKSYPAGGCVKNVNKWVNFKGGWKLSAPAKQYEAGCKTEYKTPTSVSLVYAPKGKPQAIDLCLEAYGSATDVNATPGNEGAYWCNHH